jgi:hypothetical protein
MNKTLGIWLIIIGIIFAWAAIIGISEAMYANLVQTAISAVKGGSYYSYLAVDTLDNYGVFPCMIISIILSSIGIWFLTEKSATQPHQQPPQLQTFTCKSCGTMVFAGQNFCSNCGRKLEWKPASPPS